MHPPETASAAPTPASVVHEISGWRRAVLWPVALLVRLWGMSLRFETPPADLQNYTKRDEPVVFVVWHNRLFLTPEIFRRYRGGRPLVAIISASGDGGWLAAFFSLVGMRAARGSSSRLGREAATALIEAQRAGFDVGITPDGPRGPCYDFKPGAAIVPRRTGAPLLLVGGEFESAWRLRSWDGFYLPQPFSRVRMRCELVANNQLADRDAALTRLRQQMLALNPDRQPLPERRR
ncbi:MAG TPA: lysophospholipid acyltransferase family protein [Opitutaceae bacterium]|nr:lysophospholipid acyltransferase family protein [Opitutaceae bacterium]